MLIMFLLLELVMIPQGNNVDLAAECVRIRHMSSEFDMHGFNISVTIILLERDSIEIAYRAVLSHLPMSTILYIASPVLKTHCLDNLHAFCILS